MEGEIDWLHLVSSSPERTEHLGRVLGEGLVPGSVVSLRGDLGSGKTTFVRGLALGLDVVEPVTSPTFTLMHEYAGRLPCYHFDAWMSGREALFLEGGGAEYLGGDGVAIVEWSDRVESWLPRPRLEVRLGHRSPEERSLALGLLGRGESGDREGTRLEAALARALEAVRAELD